MDGINYSNIPGRNVVPNTGFIPNPPGVNPSAIPLTPQGGPVPLLGYPPATPFSNYSVPRSPFTGK